jgi:hypothetical protein
VTLTRLVCSNSANSRSYAPANPPDIKTVTALIVKSNYSMRLSARPGPDLGFDESGEWKDFRPHPFNPDLFQHRLQFFAKSVEGRSRLPNVNDAPAAGHGTGNMGEHSLNRPIGEFLPSPFQNQFDALLVSGS